MWSSLRHICAWLRDWSVYFLPAVSNLILVLLGIIMSLPVLAERVEKTAKLRKWLAAICLIFGLIGVGFDIYQKRSSDQTNRELLGDVSVSAKNTTDLVHKTDDLLQKTTNLVGTVSVRLPELDTVLGNIADLRVQIQAAREKHDPKLLAGLQEQMKEATERADRIAKELRIITLAPRVASDLRDWPAQRSAYEKEFRNRQSEAESHCTSNEQATQDCGALHRRFETIYEGKVREWDAQLGGVISNADSVRAQILELIPKQLQTKEAEGQVQIFAQGINDPESFPIGSGAAYLVRLAQRVPPPHLN